MTITEWNLLVIKGKNKSDYCLGSPVSVSAIDSGISSAVHDCSKLSMTKVLHNGRIETTITAEKATDLKRNSTDLWQKKMVFLGVKLATFLLRRQTCLKSPFFTWIKHSIATRTIRKFIIMMCTSLVRLCLY